MPTRKAAQKSNGELIAAGAARYVQRTVPSLDDDGKPLIDPQTDDIQTRQVPITADEVFDFRPAITNRTPLFQYQESIAGFAGQIRY